MFFKNSNQKFSLFPRNLINFKLKKKEGQKNHSFSRERQNLKQKLPILNFLESEGILWYNLKAIKVSFEHLHLLWIQISKKIIILCNNIRVQLTLLRIGSKLNFIWNKIQKQSWTASQSSRFKNYGVWLMIHFECLPEVRITVSIYHIAWRKRC